ncbi:SMI1/KNR4 family protein [Streptomyces sp. NPDC048419]|uniref:SMI1/KNR4 family protein n=1 Tax=Streptomyces sp. NPDC048419 TaxID=3365547 RepID=UPI003717890D
MDDLAGTQAPGCRLTNPVESVAELERVLPGLVAHRLPTPASVDWPRLESVLGTALPADYKLLCELYPAFELSDFMLVGGPAAGAEVAWAEDTEDLEIVAEWCEDANLAVPMHPYPAPGGLLPWSTSNQGDYFLWTTSPAGPEEWTVTVASRNGAWWHYTGGAVQFLADLVGGVLELWGLPTVRPEITWVHHQPAGGSR